MSDVLMPIVVPFVLFFRDKNLIGLLSRTKSSGCKLGAA